MTKSLATGVIALVFGIGYLVMTYLLPDPAMGDAMGPKLFPYIVGFGATLTGAILLLKGYRSQKTGDEVVALQVSENKRLYLKIALTLGVATIYGIILDPVGYVISTFIFLLGIMLIINDLKRIVENIITSLSFSVITYYVFSIVLKLSLPRGLLRF